MNAIVTREPSHKIAAGIPLATRELAHHVICSTRGSALLRDAILRAKGYHVPEPVKLAPVFKPVKVRRVRSKAAPKIPTHYPKIDLIMELISEHADITVEAILSPARSYDISRPRQAAMYLARKTTPASYPDIAHQFGGKDHTTVIHAFKEVEKRILKGDAATINALCFVHERLG